MQIIDYDDRLNKLDEEMRNRKVEAIVIGTSIGGPKALQEIISSLPQNIGIPIFIVQHMANEMTGNFAKRLNSLSKIRVKEARHGDIIEKDIVYIAKGGQHMEISSLKRIVLSNGELVCGVKPAVDVLFESAAKVYKAGLVSIILTGMGKDGAKGTKNIKKQRGYCITQSVETCLSPGMVRESNKTGDVDLILPLNKIASAIMIIAKSR